MADQTYPNPTTYVSDEQTVFSPSPSSACIHTDTETGCKQVGCVAEAKTAYEACRQTYYLKQQTISGANQIKSLTQQIDSQNQRINTLTNQLNTSNIINISLAIMFGLVLIIGIVIFIKNYGKHKIISKK